MPTLVVRAQVEVVAADLVVSWELDGDDVGVDVAVGPSPEGIDHEHVVTVPPGERSARVPGRADGRHFVSISPHGGGGGLVTAERRLQFDGASNVRDLGGYRVADGGHTRWGLVFRADSLHQLSDADVAGLARWGLRAVYDLRSEDERVRMPGRVDTVWTPIFREDASLDPRPRDYSVLKSKEDGGGMLRDIYLGLLANSAPVFGRIYRGMAAGDGLPALFHCHGGKDRTGMVAAVLLRLLGVSRRDVLDDYELTSTYRVRSMQDDSYENLVARGLNPAAAAGVLGTPRWAMEEALDSLEAEHGGAETFLLGPAGMSAAEIATVRDRLVQRD